MYCQTMESIYFMWLSMITICIFYVADPTNASIVVENGGIPLIVPCLMSPVENTVST